MNPNDEIRQLILRYFYERNSNANSRMGKKGSAVKISDAKRELKLLHNLTQQNVMSNLTYLIDNGWIKTIDVVKTINIKGNQIPQTTTFYEIDARGIDKIEGGSNFEPKSKFEGINITATGQNVITLGDGNVVNAEFAELHKSLGELRDVISHSPDLDDNEKLDATVDIDSIRNQLAKAKPDRTVVARLWKGLERLATVGRVGEMLGRTAILFRPLFS